jgi:hypothetical protein
MADDDVPPGFTAKATKPEEKEDSKAVDNLASSLAVSAKVHALQHKQLCYSSSSSSSSSSKVNSDNS